MNIEDLFEMANRDLKNKKRKFLIFEISLMASVAFLLLFRMLSGGVVDYILDELDSRSEYKTITISEYEDRKEMISLLESQKNVTAICEEKTIDDWDEITVDGNEVVTQDVRLVSSDTNPFYDIDEGQTDNIIMCGRKLSESDIDKALLDEYAVNVLGYKDIKSILGKNVLLKIGREEIKAEIIGVFSKSIGKNAELDNDIFRDDSGRIDIGIGSIMISNKCDSVTANNEFFFASVDSVDNVADVVAEIEKNTQANVYSEMQMANSILLGFGKVKNAFKLVSIILLFVSMITILSVLFVVIESNYKWYELLNILGYRKGHIKALNAIETSIVSIKALLGGVLISVLFMVVLNNIVRKTIGTSNMFEFPTMTFIILGGGVILLCNAISLLYTTKVLKNGVEDEKKN